MSTVVFSSFLEDAQCATGSTSPALTETTLTAFDDGTTDTWLFLRFKLPVPRNAVITSSNALWLVLTSVWNAEYSMRVYAHAADNSGAFSASEDLTARALTAAYVTWTPSASAAGATVAYAITAVFQEIVSRTGWCYNNALTLIVYAYDSVKTDAPFVVASDENTTYNAPVLSVAYTGGDVVTYGTSGSVDVIQG